MKQKFSLWQLLGFAVTSLGGTLLHFLYDWTGQSLLVAPFSGVNESTWEHMKLLFFPMFFFALVQRYFFRDAENFWCIKFRGITLGILMIPVLFYTYNGIFGSSPDWINIAIFFISAAIAYLWETRTWNRKTVRCKSPKTAFLALLLIGAAFVLFTFRTPQIAIFRDPMSGGYGLDA